MSDFCFISSRLVWLFSIVPNEAPYGMEAVLLNSSAVFLKWKAPEWKDEHGKCIRHPDHGLPPDTQYCRRVFVVGRWIIYKTFDDDTNNDG